MKILTYSDLHLEFGDHFSLPADVDGDVMVLAGDIITFNRPDPLARFLEGWGGKPVLFIAGNHEYYHGTLGGSSHAAFEEFISERIPNVTFLKNQGTTLGRDRHFFGGTMWTDFNKGDFYKMKAAERGMNDYRMITCHGKRLTAEETARQHSEFIKEVTKWFETPLVGPRIVITHHAPERHPDSKYPEDGLTPAFNATDVAAEIIDKHQPDLWIYGHTHQCADYMRGKTRIISNQSGYPGNVMGTWECSGEFDEMGIPTDV